MRRLSLLIAALCGCIFTCSARAQIEPLILGDTYVGRLGSSSEVDALPFADLEGTLLDAVITGSNGLRPTVSLYDTGSGTQVDLTGHLEGVGSERLSILALPLPSTGGYELRISGSGVFPASYRCITRRTDSRENLRFIRLGVLSNGAAVEVVRFVAIGGAVVSLDVKSGRASRWNPAIRRVESPTGQHLDVSAHVRESRGRARLLAWTTPAETGEYLMVLDSRDGSFGDFTVKGALKSPKSNRVITDPGRSQRTTLLLSREVTLLSNSQSLFHGFCRMGADRIGVLATANDFASAFYYRMSSNSWSGPVAHPVPSREVLYEPVSGGEGSMLVLSREWNSNRPGRTFDFGASGSVLVSTEVQADRILRFPGGRVAAVSAISDFGMPAVYVYDEAGRAWSGSTSRQQFPHQPLAILPGGESSFQVIYRPSYGSDLRISIRAFDGSELQDVVLDQTVSGVPFVAHDQQGNAMMVVVNPHPLGSELLYSKYHPASGWEPLESLRVLDQRAIKVELSLAEDGTSAVCVVLDDFSLGANLVVARSIAGGPFIWDILHMTWGVARASRNDPPWIHAAPGGDFLLQSATHAPPQVFVAGAKGTADWSEWQYIAGGTFNQAVIRSDGDFCVGVGSGGTGPFLIAAQATLPFGLEIHRVGLESR